MYRLSYHTHDRLVVLLLHHSWTKQTPYSDHVSLYSSPPCPAPTLKLIFLASVPGRDDRTLPYFFYARRPTTRAKPRKSTSNQKLKVCASALHHFISASTSTRTRTRIRIRIRSNKPCSATNENKSACEQPVDNSIHHTS